MHGRMDDATACADASALCVLEPGPVSRTLPPVARRIARAVARGDAGTMLPPLLALRDGPDGGRLAVADGPLSGADTAHALLALWTVSTVMEDIMKK